MKNFDFDEWRRRYMNWMNHNKTRVMDFFRRQDRDNDGKVTRKEFIDGIMASSEYSIMFCYSCPALNWSFCPNDKSHALSGKDAAWPQIIHILFTAFTTKVKVQ